VDNIDAHKNEMVLNSINKSMFTESSMDTAESVIVTLILVSTANIDWNCAFQEEGCADSDQDVE